MRSNFSFDYTPNLADARFGIHLTQWAGTRRKLRTLMLGFVMPALLMTASLSSGADASAIPMAAAEGLAFGAAWSVLFFTAFNAWMAR